METDGFQVFFSYWEECLLIRVTTSDGNTLPIIPLNRLRDSVLSGIFEQEVTAALSPHAGITAAVDRSRFAEMYEHKVLRLNTPTPYQQRMLNECKGCRHLHIMGAAGTGKTFLGMLYTLSKLRSDPNARVLFVVQSLALALFFVMWMCVRILADAKEIDSPTVQASMEAVLQRLDVLYPAPGQETGTLLHRRFKYTIS